MSNVNDYLLWRGDIPINNKFPFNEVDAMILARFSYLRFDIIHFEGKTTIEEIANQMKSLDNEQFLYNGDKDLITNLGKSARFKDMVISDYIKVQEKEEEKQFGAVTIHISERELYISFIGTNSTITGWKEDFNMSFMLHVPCQIAGKEYLEKIANEYMDKKIRIGGHSKGGNVAIYSAITASNDVQNRILKVYNYDGPGLNMDILKQYANKRILDKVVTYLPQDSIIGRILHHEEMTIVTSSIEKGIYQHDIYSWQVMQCYLIKLDKNTESSEEVNEILTNWLNDTTTEQRKIFIDSVFELLYSTNAETLRDISKNLSTNIPKILRKYRQLSKDDREIITRMIITFSKIYFGVIKERENNKINQKIEEYKNVSKKKLEELEAKYRRKIEN